jgi:hypothetical protein
MKLTPEEETSARIVGTAIAIVVLFYVIALFVPPIVRAIKPVLIGDPPANRWSK